MRVNPSGSPHCASLIIDPSCIGSAKLINIGMPRAPSMHRCMLPPPPDILANWDNTQSCIHKGKLLGTDVNRASPLQVFTELQMSIGEKQLQRLSKVHVSSKLFLFSSALCELLLVSSFTEMKVLSHLTL